MVRSCLLEYPGMITEWSLLMVGGIDNGTGGFSFKAAFVLRDYDEAVKNYVSNCPFATGSHPLH